MASEPKGGLCLAQIVPAQGMLWFARLLKPYTLFGDPNWQHCVIESDVLLAGGDVEIGGRYAAQDKLGYRWMGASVSLRIELAVEIAGSARPPMESLKDLYDRVGTSLFIPESVPAAFGVLVMAQGDPRQSAIYAAALSGDADTIAAMACAIAGAWKGAGDFDPVHLQRLRQANPELDFEGVARGLWRLAQDNQRVSDIKPQ